MLYQSSKRLNQLQERCILLGPGNLIEHYHANNFMCLNVVRLHPQLSWVENIWKPFLWSWAINKLAILGITVAIRRYSTGSLAIDRSSFPYVRYRILISSLWGTTVHSESTWNLHSKGKKKTVHVPSSNFIHEAFSNWMPVDTPIIVRHGTSQL